MRPESPKQLPRALVLVLCSLPAAWPAAAQPVATSAEGPPAVDAPAAGEPGSARTPAEACPRILLRSTPAFLFADDFESGDAAAWGAAAVRLSARRVLDLGFEVQLDGAVIGDHLLRLDLETPKGHVYQRLTVPFSSSPSAAVTRKVADHPRPLPVQVSTARGAGLAPAVSFSLPVAGTPIVHSSLYGQWRARPFLDESTHPCGDALTFELTP